MGKTGKSNCAMVKRGSVQDRNTSKPIIKRGKYVALSTWRFRDRRSRSFARQQSPGGIPKNGTGQRPDSSARNARTLDREGYSMAAPRESDLIASAFLPELHRILSRVER